MGDPAGGCGPDRGCRLTSRRGVFLGAMVAVGLGVVTWVTFTFKDLNPPQAAHACVLPETDIGTFIRVPGGSFIKSADGIYPEEGSPARVHVSPFLLEVNEVTNDEFAAFVTATDYVTEAERSHGSAQFVEAATPSDLLSWWKMDPNATWRSPAGQGSDLTAKGRLPVVHVTLNDARAYAAWAHARLPNEVEWEYAASLGLADPDNPLSGIVSPKGEALANIWNGIFPVINTGDDGYVGLAPVGCFAANRIGAYDMIGNVWEWTETPYGDGSPKFTIKGGSFLCSDTYCRRYRAAARESLEPDFSTAHTGFRLVKDPLQ